MRVVNLMDDRPTLSELVDVVESGEESEIVVTRNGKPAARITAIQPAKKVRQPLGFLNGKYPPMSLEQFNASNDEVERLFYGEAD